MADSGISIDKIRSGSAGAVNSGVVDLRRLLVSEVGPSLDDAYLDDEFVVPPNIVPTRVTFRAVTNMAAVRGSQSPAYVASRRRSRCRELAESIGNLQHNLQSIPLVVATQPILSEIKNLVASIQRIESEANTREILRQVRDTLLNGQWEKYQSVEVCRHIASVVEKLGHSLDVEFNEIDLCAAKLENLGFEIAGFAFPNE
ncbi:hypothetical protein NHH03_16800 [Stieleria sp. TO1_6]|uniref:hypothetical protein n=1 Tax=Stieleria tagensis TaxID=2956795 RepID=UPI00209B5C50|nr:hypothetical protein [Stieleria tagensis]MCO8123411.1 hypothetical protein [Stieleria tagensis]